MTRINMKMVDEVMSYIEANREQWHQGAWGAAEFDQDIIEALGKSGIRALLAEDPNNPACKTAFCFAGHACVTVGGFKPDYSRVIGDYFDPDYIRMEHVKDENGYRSRIDEKARELLGLRSSEADVLFSGANTLTQLRKMVAFMRAFDRLDYGYKDWEPKCEHCGTGRDFTQPYQLVSLLPPMQAAP